jgi:hypothetical protein
MRQLRCRWRTITLDVILLVDASPYRISFTSAPISGSESCILINSLASAPTMFGKRKQPRRPRPCHGPASFRDTALWISDTYGTITLDCAGNINERLKRFVLIMFLPVTAMSDFVGLVGGGGGF